MTTNRDEPADADEPAPDPVGDPWGPDPKHPLTRARDAMILTATLVALTVAAYFGAQLLLSTTNDTTSREVFHAEWNAVVRNIATLPGRATLESDRATASKYREFCRDAESRGIDPDPELIAAWVEMIETLNRNVRDRFDLWEAPDRWHRDLSPKPPADSPRESPG